MPTSARTWHHRIMVWPAHRTTIHRTLGRWPARRTIKRCTLGHRSHAAPSFMAFPVLPNTPCRGRCPHRPAHRTIEFPYRLVRIRPGIPGIVTPYRRDDVGIVPYEHVRTADVTRRAGPMCPAVGTHRKPSDRPIDSNRVGRGLAPAAGTHLPRCGGEPPHIPHGGTRRCRPTFLDGLPMWFVGRDLCVPPLVRIENHRTGRLIPTA